MSIKLETRVSDLQKYLAKLEASMNRSTAMDALRRKIYDGYSDLGDALTNAKRTASVYLEAGPAFDKLPLARCAGAVALEKWARQHGQDVAHDGDEYSGNTTYGAAWSTTGTAYAYTGTDKGASYSRACTYRKTDADHRVMLDPAGVVVLYDNQDLVGLSDREGLPLIALYPDCSAVWVRRKGKGIVSERGWIAWDGLRLFHSTKSLAHAQKGLRRKQAAAEREAKRVADDAKNERRARLVARLCGGATATIEDAKRLGFCTPGIEAFQHRHGIGDTAPLPELVRSGNALAMKLALSVARKVKRSAKA